MSEIVRSPWTNLQVYNLNRWQSHGPAFTCGERDDHQTNGTLVATTEGWVCMEEGCTYTQDWAHAFMAADISVGATPPAPETQT